MSNTYIEAYWHSYGFKTRFDAAVALDEAFASGDILPGEGPSIESYLARHKNGVDVAERWGIKCKINRNG